ncbi:hypothetical protein FGU46_03175 [Methanobacterium sp. CWC-01]|uniref:hypothetical protein n=1 Tax=Methanobacterium aridiramus TaxID=2584467 RepID=UPI002576DC17|nr:hypothetical protein [Methanobacterium sp. CWC-01]WJI09161.1 hypothetical protein FGU46_03175 [Methanobacterium sp. CWC-01]
MKTVKFEKLYPKLQGRWFTTIRKTTDLTEGMIVTCQTPMTRFKSRVTFTHETTLDRVPTSTLTYDTDTTTRLEALKELQQYYPYLTTQSSIILIGLERLEGYQ